MLNGIGLESLLGSVPLESNSEKTELLSPISEAEKKSTQRTKGSQFELDAWRREGGGSNELVHPGDLPSEGLVEVGSESSNDGRPEVTGVERFGDVGRGELDCFGGKEGREGCEGREGELELEAKSELLF